MSGEETDTYSFDKYKKESRVFILGAGFSADAGIPLTSPLLSLTMKKFSDECEVIFSRVDGYAKECFESPDTEIDYSKVNFSELCTFLEYIELREYGGGERWSDEGSREKLALKFYLAKTIVESTPLDNRIPQLYLDFAEQLQEKDVVISFNWDGLLENALDFLGKPYTYNFSEQNAIKLCKLHGSVNWRLGSPNNLGKPANTLGWQPLQFAEIMMQTEMYYTKALLRHETWRNYSPLGEVQPFLVLPGYGKAFDVRANAVLWYKPEFAFWARHDVYIIGLSVSHDDFFIRSFFLSNLPYIGGDGRKTVIISPDDRASKNYAFVLSKEHVELLNEDFSNKHILMMKDRLKDA